MCPMQVCVCIEPSGILSPLVTSPVWTKNHLAMLGVVRHYVCFAFVFVYRKKEAGANLSTITFKCFIHLLFVLLVGIIKDCGSVEIINAL